MPNVAEIQKQLQELFREQLQIDVPDPATDLIDSGLLDSLVFVDLLMLLESGFGLKIELEDLDFAEFRSLTRIADLILKDQSSASPEAGSTASQDAGFGSEVSLSIYGESR